MDWESDFTNELRITIFKWHCYNRLQKCVDVPLIFFMENMGKHTSAISKAALSILIFLQ